MSTIKYLSNISLENLELQNAKLQVVASDPVLSGATYEGRVIYNSTDNAIKFHNGAASNYWVTLDGSGDISSVAVNPGEGLEVEAGSSSATSGDFSVTLGLASSVAGTYLGYNAGVINHDNTTLSSTTSSVSPGYSGTFTTIDSITTNATGHVTAVNTKTVTIPASDNTNTDTLQTISSDSTNADRFITTVANSTGAQEGLSHSTLTYNPSTETLNVTNLIVSGTSTTINTEEINLADNIIKINSNHTGAPTENGGIEVERGTSTDAILIWNETADRWEHGISGTGVGTNYSIPKNHFFTLTNAGDVSKTGNTYTVTHNMGTKNVIIQVVGSTDYETVFVDSKRPSDNTITVEFADTVTDGDYIVFLSTVG